jgi:hypothetical protein
MFRFSCLRAAQPPMQKRASQAQRHTEDKATWSMQIRHQPGHLADGSLVIDHLVFRCRLLVLVCKRRLKDLKKS